MDTLFRTPFLDIFKQGGVDRDIRMMVAEGALGLRAEELRLTLEFLLTDPDPEIARTAEATLLSVRAGDAAAAQPYVAPEPDPEPEENLSPEEKETKKQNTLQKISALNPAQRLGLAMKGSREERAILIRDPNRIVTAAVLSSPKMNDTEVAAIAKMQNVSEDVLRTIAKNRAWLKNYSVVLAVVKNPKTPVALSMNLMARLGEKDLKLLTTDRNVPDVLRMQARRKMVGADK